MGIDEPIRIWFFWDSASGVKAVGGIGDRTGDDYNEEDDQARWNGGKSRTFNNRWERRDGETTGRPPEGRHSGLQGMCVEIST